MEKFVTVASYTYAAEIAVLKTILEHNKIKHFFQNETIVSVDPFASLAYGGIKLKVHPNDVATVLEIIKNLDEDNSLRVVK